VSQAQHNRAVFLDRDGVLIRAIVRNGKPYSVQAPEQIEILDGVSAACSQLAELGYLLIMITNQPEIARGTISQAFVEQTNRRIANSLRLTDFRVCSHDDFDQCECRKPLPGLITQAAKDYAVNLASSYVVGDRWRDIEAGRRAGCRTVFIDHGYNEPRPSSPDHSAASLMAAVNWIRSQT
jgi:D-glycero-D-manno-heptose 1,7-bisphosphate phosphatase